MSRLEELTSRGLVSSDDRDEWLRVRREGVTATEVAKLASEGPAYARDLVMQKRDGVTVDLSGNRYVQRGNDREPVIAQWVHDKWPHFEANSILFRADNTRDVYDHGREYLATPDMVGENEWDAELELVEIKTSKHDLHPDRPHFRETTYYDQMQWQMFVTGAVACLFVWEQHDDDWDNGPAPVESEPGTYWVSRDDGRIGELIDVADHFLDLLEAPVSDITRLSDMVARRFELKDSLAAVEDAIAAWMVEHEKESEKTPSGSVSYSTPKPRKFFNQMRFRSEHAELADEFMDESAAGKPTLRITRSRA